MNIDFELILSILTIIAGVLWIAKILLRRKERHVPKWVESVASFFSVLLIVLVFRSFFFEPFRIPSGSLEPTLLVGDFVLVNKFHFGLRLPVTHTKLVGFSEPKRGDIVVFRWPPNPSFNYIKRIIGVPGDHIVYKNKVLTINDKLAPQDHPEFTIDRDGQGRSWKVKQLEENLNDHLHAIYVRPDVPAEDFDVTVPPKSYFAMGDNRDDSSDSRFWGFVPEDNIVGQAFRVWFSWDSLTDSVRWSRIGKRII